MTPDQKMQSRIQSRESFAKCHLSPARLTTHERAYDVLLSCHDQELSANEVSRIAGMSHQWAKSALDDLVRRGVAVASLRPSHKSGPSNVTVYRVRHEP